MNPEITLRETFQSPYEQYREHIGKPFKYISKRIFDNEGEQSETHLIEFADSTRIEALPEEIYSGTGWEPISANNLK